LQKSLHFCGSQTHLHHLRETMLAREKVQNGFSVIPSFLYNPKHGPTQG
jgi:hypothetical protein